MNQPSGRQGITYEIVAAAADGIAANGERPTLRGVRAAVGTGSMNTIQKHLTAWQAARESEPVAVLPADLQQAIQVGVERGVSKLLVERQAELDQVKTALQIEQQARQQAEQRVAVLETELADALARERACMGHLAGKREQA